MGNAENAKAKYRGRASEYIGTGKQFLNVSQKTTLRLIMII